MAGNEPDPASDLRDAQRYAGARGARAGLDARIARVRRLALALPGVVERPHWNLPSFRVNGRIFATIHEHTGRVMVKLSPEQQEEWETREPGVVSPVPGGWGRNGATFVELRSARSAMLRTLLRLAWLNAAPKRVTRSRGATRHEQGTAPRKRGADRGRSTAP